MRHLRPRIGAVLLGVAVLVLSGCGGDGGGGGSGSGSGGGGGGGEQRSLQAQGIKWTSANLQLKANTKYTLTVENKDSAEHNFTFKEANAEKDVEGGKTITVDFTAPAAGTYQFVCEYHPGQMTGTITVA